MMMGNLPPLMEFQDFDQKSELSLQALGLVTDTTRIAQARPVW